MPVKILAHGDTDGICSAALVKSRFPDAEVWFARPVSLPRYLAETEPGTTVIICDVAISETQKDDLFKRIRELAQRDEVIYMDHHPLPPDTLKKDVPATQFAHEIGVSTSELAFKIFVGDPASDLDRVALWGAIGDYCEETDFVRDGLSKYDRRTIYMEAGLLSQALGDAAGDYDYKREVVLRLSRGELPTEIPNIVDRAIKATKKEWENYEYVKRNVVKEGNLAIVYDLPSGSLGKAAMHALGVAGTDVGACTRRDGDEIDISLRRRAGAKIDLNVLLRHVTARLGGSGGGHEGAAGATIPADLLPTFIETLKREISPVIGREPGLRR
ncbi:MAG: DHHA1 domain-containing protein [Candidatus Hadarchaeales archaeon]